NAEPGTGFHARQTKNRKYASVDGFCCRCKTEPEPALQLTAQEIQLRYRQHYSSCPSGASGRSATSFLRFLETSTLNSSKSSLVSSLILLSSACASAQSR